MRSKRVNRQGGFSLGDLAAQIIIAKTVEGRGLGLSIVLRMIVDLIVLRTKGLKGIRVEGSILASSVGRKGIMPMNVEF
ncbi:hypothetical protein A2U01_0085173, partial [Trifolium medium]|nr:hypothetical protein [Trifolium medium]